VALKTHELVSKKSVLSWRSDGALY
jgi:hypothetical protein